MKRIFTIVIVLIAITTSCYYDKKEVLYPDNRCDTSGVTYSRTIAPLIEKNCLSCHGSAMYAQAGGGYNLQGYTNISAYADRGGLLVRSITGAPGVILMPPGGGLSSCDINKIITWVNAGAPNN